MNSSNSKLFNEENYLLERLAQSDEDAFEYVFEKYYPRLCLYASSFGTDQTLAEDIAKEAFIKIWKSDKNYKSLEHLKNSLYQSTKQVALNKQLALKRSIQREEYFFDNQEQYEDSPLHQIIHAEVMGELYAAIQKLPEQAKMVVILSYLEGKTNQEIADEMQISLQTVKNYKLRAIKQLRSILTPETYLIFLSVYKIFEKFSLG